MITNLLNSIAKAWIKAEQARTEGDKRHGKLEVREYITD